jgi:rhodanese-related sulfurtransferase
MKINSKTSIVIGLVIVIISFFAYKSLGSNKNNSVRKGIVSEGVQLVDPAAFSELVKNGNGFLVDVHIPEQTHIPGTDAFIPYNEISDNIDEFPQDKSTPILVYCRSGSMSKSASEEISKLGYTNVYDLNGGINAYKKQYSEVVITPGSQDLGTVVYGDVPTTTFTLTNFTPNPLKITRVSTSCGCTSAEVEEKELDPFESTIVNVSFNPAVHESDEDLGDIVRTIFIQTDNSNFERVTAEITAHVIKK